MSNNKKKKNTGSSRVIATNRRAYHDYFVLETLEAGLVLTGTEIKSIRRGKVSLNESFARVDKGEVWLFAAQIAIYEEGNIHNHKPDRTRKLLLNRDEIRKLTGKVQQQGLTLVPLKLYFERAWVKCELGLCKGKKQHDKRETIAKRDTQREIDRAMRHNG